MVLERDEEQALPPEALGMIRLRVAARWGAGVLLLVAFGVIAVTHDAVGSGIVTLVVAGLIVAGWWLFSARWYRSVIWRLDDATIEIRFGVVVRRHLVMPLAGVQNVSVTAGPIARARGLATVTVHSAGVETPNLTLPDVDAATAAALRKALASPVIVPA